MIEIICETCAQPFRSYPSLKRRFCSRACKGLRGGKARLPLVACGRCGVSFKTRLSGDGKGYTRFCSKRCSARWRVSQRLGQFDKLAWTRRYRQGLRSGIRIDVDYIWRRDGGICQVCRRPVPREVVSLDHIIPISRGGLHEPRNVQATHRLCNSRRSAFGPAQIRLMA